MIFKRRTPGQKIAKEMAALVREIHHRDLDLELRHCTVQLHLVEADLLKISVVLEGVSRG